jgi:wyosine [tRNA(Phe)-imidazoG37] synthetase (radical SAM superfamily)
LQIQGAMLPRSLRACIMYDSLYVKANGEMPCWDDVGEARILRTLGYDDLITGNEEDLFSFSELRYIRTSFAHGKTPYPGLCEFCAVREHGPLIAEVKPGTIRILHIEASYLCQLSCLQCIPAKDRKHLKDGPYHMPPRVFEAVLRKLRSEGVRQIGIVHFEGRGDPLMNPLLGELIDLTHLVYPGARTMVTTHASFPYKPWIVRLDVLRVSIDGAFPDSYARYRVGGNLATALNFLQCLREERRRLGSSLRVIWKYILFEWNDSDEEIRHAARLAKELDVSLEFLLTHGPGKSKRFSNLTELQQSLQSLATSARAETTFQLKDLPELPPQIEPEDEIRSLLALAKTHILSHDERSAIRLILLALHYDGLPFDSRQPPSRSVIRAAVPILLTHGRYPATFAGMSEILQLWGDSAGSVLLLKKYLQIVTTLSWLDRAWLSLRLRFRLRTRLREAALRLESPRKFFLRTP